METSSIVGKLLKASEVHSRAVCVALHTLTISLIVRLPYSCRSLVLLKSIEMQLVLLTNSTRWILETSVTTS